MWDTELLNFTVSACDFGDTSIVPDTVNLMLLWPNDTIQAFEMEEVASNYSLNPNNNSLFYDSTFKEFHIGLNLSEYYTFMQDKIVLYYFDAELTDGNHSLHYDINYENNNNTWYFLFIRHLPSEGAYIYGYEVSDPLWSRKWDSWEFYGFDWFGSTVQVDRVIQPICEEHVLRFKTWIVHPEGTHEEIYNNTGFEIKPELEMIKLNELGSHFFRVDMEWGGYDPTMNSDMYFVEILGDGHYTYEWEDVSDLDETFEPGAWEFRIYVEDHHQNETMFRGKHKIWHTGSFDSMWKVWWGTPFVDEEDPMKNFFGIWRPILTAIGFVGVGAATLGKQYQYAKAISLITTIFDLASKGMGLWSFFESGDSGATLGLAINSIMMAVMMVFILEIGTLGRLLADAKQVEIHNILGGRIVNWRANNKVASVISKVIRILVILNLFLMVFCNPGAMVTMGPFTMFLALNFLYKKHSDGKSLLGKNEAYLLPFLTMLISGLGFMASGPVENSLGMAAFLESDIGIIYSNIASFLEFLPIQMITFLVSGLSMGAVLNILGFQTTTKKDSATGETFDPVPKGGIDFIKNGQGSGFDYTKSLAIYSAFALALAGVSFGAFMAQTSFGVVGMNILQEMLSTDQDQELDNTEDYGTYNGEES